jgi:hypothetical protein
MVFNDILMSSSSHTHPRSHTSTPQLFTSPTQTALTNPDLLELILENLSIEHVWELSSEDVVSRRRVLASAALTSKAFLEPSLDRLWRSLDKLFPLFRLLKAFYRSDSTFVSTSSWFRFWGFC